MLAERAGSNDSSGWIRTGLDSGTFWQAIEDLAVDTGGETKGEANNEYFTGFGVVDIPIRVYLWVRGKCWYKVWYLRLPGY
jgi:hypothetical protein